ncbi:hypothetical protein SAMN05446037_100136 [Anaerovirgula multivorans]|uniref:Uncharacterized protein n=1 Tax=Anaerovirgula multivorans TaxID=312168 RepID=A0A238ZQE1_9FIRM|nr:hypothetical protein [Anaerovirgula multivorans]SNR85585.1 hypothetical protein SAMN05446037_100136 [Anaerovirgula multivorans]
MKALTTKIKKLIEAIGVDEAMENIEQMVHHQQIETFGELEDAIEEELILLEVEI